MSTLYELTGQFKELLELIEQGELDQTMLKDTLEGIDCEIELKADGYAKVIKEIEGNISTIKTEIDRLSGKKSSMENSIKTMKQALETAMKATGKLKFKTELFSFGIQKNPPSLVLDSCIIPCEFLIQKEPEPDKNAIKEALKNGANFDFAHLESSESVRIR